VTFSTPLGRLGRTGPSFWELFVRSIFLWAIGVPIPIILLLAFCTHHF
jgi:hypothetical protein